MDNAPRRTAAGFWATPYVCRGVEHAIITAANPDTNRQAADQVLAAESVIDDTMRTAARRGLLRHT